MTQTAAHATTPPAADPAFAAVISHIDGVVTDTAAWTPPLPLNVVGTKACTWAERGR